MRRHAQYKERVDGMYAPSRYLDAYLQATGHSPPESQTGIHVGLFKFVDRAPSTWLEYAGCGRRLAHLMIDDDGILPDSISIRLNHPITPVHDQVTEAPSHRREPADLLV